MPDLTPEQAAILSLLDEIDALKTRLIRMESEVVDLRVSVAAMTAGNVVRLPVRGVVR